MTLVFIFVAIAFTAYALYQTVVPLVLSREDQMRAELLDEELAQIEVLVARRQALVQALRDLTYDLETDKIEKVDYERFKTSCERQAVAVMRKLEAMHGTSLWRERIDLELAGLLGEVVVEASGAVETPTTAPQVSAVPSNRPLRVNFKLETPATAPQVSAACAECGAHLEAQARFCSQCATPVTRPQDTAPAPAASAVVEQASAEQESTTEQDSTAKPQGTAEPPTAPSTHNEATATEVQP